MDLLLHPADDQGRGRPDRRGRLSTVGHRQAFRAFARAAKRAGIRFMLIGGTFRDVAVRAASTRDIDIVLIDQKDLAPELMAAAGFARVPRAPYVWRYDAEGRTVDLEIAAVASSMEPAGPFSVAFQHAETAVVEGIEVAVPRIEDFVILKLLAAAADRRRRARDLADVQAALEAFAGRAGTEGETMLTKEEAHRFAEHWVAAWNAHDLDRIMSHYEAEVELISPVAAQLVNAPEGRVAGKINLRAYFQKGLAAFPELHFELRDVMWGVKSIVLYYANQRGTHTGEYMELSPRGKVVRVVANYSG